MPAEIPLKIKNKLSTDPRAHEFEAIDFIPITHGGTNAQTAAQALTNLGGIPVTDIGAPNGVCPLGGDTKIPVAYIPAVALPEVFIVADSTARLALTVQNGDEAIQMDDNSQWIYDGTTWYERALTGPSPISVEDDGVPIQNAVVLNFVGDAKVVGQGAGVVDIEIDQPRALLRNGVTVVLLE